MRKMTTRPGAIRRILVPSDFSDYSDRAVEYAAHFAKGFGARIILLHVIEPFPYSASDFLTLVDHSKALNAIAASLLENQRKRLIRPDLAVETRLVSGPAYSEILRAAEKEKADMIVMGTHGRSGLGHFLMGSVAEKVVRLAGCPVVTVRGGKRGRGKGRAAPKKK